MTTTAKLTVPQQRFLEDLRRYPDQTFPWPSATMKALIKKGIIEKDACRTSPSGTRFWTYRANA
jgi:hypothetical protein